MKTWYFVDAGSTFRFVEYWEIERFRKGKATLWQGDFLPTTIRYVSVEATTDPDHPDYKPFEDAVNDKGYIRTPWAEKGVTVRTLTWTPDQRKEKMLIAAIKAHASEVGD